MIKHCKVLINNDAVTVVDIDGIKIQFPSIHREAQYLDINIGGNETEDIKNVSKTASANISDKPKKRVTKKTTAKIV